MLEKNRARSALASLDSESGSAGLSLRQRQDFMHSDPAFGHARISAGLRYCLDDILRQRGAGSLLDKELEIALFYI